MISAKPTLKGLPWNGKRMTLIAGFRCSDGLILAADREESTEMSKRSVAKISDLLGDGWAGCVATAGNAATADLAVAELQEKLRAVDRDAINTDSQGLIREVLRDIYSNYIWKNPDRDRDLLDFSLIIGLNTNQFGNEKELRLYRTVGIVPQPIEKFVCMGVGQELGNYFADRLYSKTMGWRQMLLLTVFIFREAKSAVRDVGQGTDIDILFTEGGLTHIGAPSTEELESKIPEFRESIKLWIAKKAMPAWLKGDELDLGKWARNVSAVFGRDVGHLAVYPPAGKKNGDRKK